MILRECFHYWLHRYGELFLVGEQTYRGLFFQPPAGLLRWRFSPDELGELPRPLWAVAVAPTTNLPSNTILLWRNVSYRILWQLAFRLNDVPVYRLLLLEPVV
ncbi:MAG: hypothetical protein N2651_08915 [Fimbriimonadales bacterium]|nr:hypothetical protein [Fimbriimonadales bacterium]